jgi:hypothetical protein
MHTQDHLADIQISLYTHGSAVYANTNLYFPIFFRPTFAVQYLENSKKWQMKQLVFQKIPIVFLKNKFIWHATQTFQTTPFPQP